MNIRIVEQTQTDNSSDGGITLEVTLDVEDLTQLKADAARALEIERNLPPEARTPLASAEESTYVAHFIQQRATNDALEARGIIPVAIPRVTVTDASAETSYSCSINVHPRPAIGLSSLDPVDLKTNRVAKPGFSLQAARNGDSNAEFIDDEKVLRMTMVNRLVGDLPESAMRALGAERAEAFERELAQHGLDAESWCAARGYDEEQYSLMMTRNALSDAHWNYALDAVFNGLGLTLTDDDLLTAFEIEHPGCSQQLLELHDLHNDLYLMAEKVRRGKALMWLRDNALR